MKRILEHFHPCSRLNRKREQYVKQTTMPEHIKALVQTPRLEAAQFAQDANYIVLDLETTGLDSEEDLILSIGWVDIANGKVDLATSQHMYINSDSQIKPETAVIVSFTRISTTTTQRVLSSLTIDITATYRRRMHRLHTPNVAAILSDIIYCLARVDNHAFRAFTT